MKPPLPFHPPARKTNRKIFSAGFTLIELLLAACLIPLIGLSIYANMSSGIKIWQRLHRQASIEDLSIFAMKVSRNFESSIKYAPNQFEGDKDSVQFMALMRTDKTLGDDLGIGRVHLFYDAGSKSIKRDVKNLSQMYRDSGSKPETLLANVTSFRASFLTMDKQEQIFKWLEEWVDHPDEMPVAVRFEFEWSDLSGGRSVKKTFMIPAGGR